MKLKFKDQIIDIHDSWTHFFESQLNELKKIESLIGDSFTPEADKIFKIFSVPLHEIKYVIVGQDPYPQKGVATGRSFEVESGLPNLEKKA